MIEQSLVADLILRNRHFLDAFASGLSGDLFAILQNAQKEILGKLEKPKMNELSRAHYKAVLAESSSILKEAYQEMGQETLESMSQAAQLEYWAVANAIRSEAGLKKIREDAPNMGLPEKALRHILTVPVGGYKLSDLMSKMQKDHQVMIRYALTQGLVQGQGMYTIARNIRRSTGMAMQASRTLARTTMMEASNQALLEVYTENGKYITGYRWLGTLDSRTCMICAYLDGKMHDTVGGFPFEPPAHPNCRCVIAPETVFEDKALERPAKVWDKEQGKYVYQKVPASEGYGEWFARQNEEFQKEYLGPRRFELWKTGDLKFDQFIGTRDGQPMPLRLDTLQRRYGISPLREFENTKDAENWLSDRFGIDVNYKNFDPFVANTLNKVIFDHLSEWPKLKEITNYCGDYKKQMIGIHADEIKRSIHRLKDLVKDGKITKENYDGQLKELRKLFKETINKIDNDAIAMTWDIHFFEKSSMDKWAGVSIFPDWVSLDKDILAKKFSDFMGIDPNWFPPGCFKMGAILTHEMGHQINYLMRSIPYRHITDEEYTKIEKIYRKCKVAGTIKTSVSGYAEYAAIQKNDIREFIAECWNEFKNNPGAREVSVEVGGLLVDALKKIHGL